MPTPVVNSAAAPDISPPRSLSANPLVSHIRIPTPCLKSAISGTPSFELADGSVHQLPTGGDRPVSHFVSARRALQTGRETRTGMPTAGGSLQASELLQCASGPPPGVAPGRRAPPHPAGGTTSQQLQAAVQPPVPSKHAADSNHRTHSAGAASQPQGPPTGQVPTWPPLAAAAMDGRPPLEQPLRAATGSTHAHGAAGSQGWAASLKQDIAIQSVVVVAQLLVVATQWNKAQGGLLVRVQPALVLLSLALSLLIMLAWPKFYTRNRWDELGKGGLGRQRWWVRTLMGASRAGRQAGRRGDAQLAKDTRS